VKKYCALLFLVLLVSCNKKTVIENTENTETIVAENVPEIECFYVWDQGLLIFYDGKIYYIDNSAEKYTILPEDSYYLAPDGYYRQIIDKHLTGLRSDELVFISGEYFSEFFTDFFDDSVNEYSNFDEYENYEFHYRNIKKITGSKFYTEYINGKLIEYKPENLYSTYMVGCKCHPYWWNPQSIPWVEGEADAGIGSYIEIEYNSPVKALSILTGFVDKNNLKLYKENNRPKVITITDFDNNTEYTVDIQDYVHFSDITFENLTQHIKITIKDVYPGTKYNDTCITALVERVHINTNRANFLLRLLNEAIENYEMF
jgi:hypothetical protein